MLGFKRARQKGLKTRCDWFDMKVTLIGLIVQDVKFEEFSNSFFELFDMMC